MNSTVKTMPDGLSTSELEAVAQGNRRALAKALTAVDKHHAAIPGPAKRPPCFGITGAPGVGKSTLINAIITALRARGLNVGALLVDPTHPVTGGALLGDRIRMNEHNQDSHVFVRSLGSRGGTGGVSSDLESALNLMAHFPFDILLVETVGVGQLDMGIASFVDKVLVVSPPGSGDDIQAMKASNLDIADGVIINKADMPDEQVRRHENTLMMRAQLDPRAAEVPLFKTVALTGEGVEELVAKFMLQT